MRGWHLALRHDPRWVAAWVAGVGVGVSLGCSFGLTARVFGEQQVESREASSEGLSSYCSSFSWRCLVTVVTTCSEERACPVAGSTMAQVLFN